MRFKGTVVKILVYALSIIIIILFQTTISDYMKINNVKPNLILVYTVCTSILEGSKGGGIIGLFAGLALDIIAGKIIGFYALFGMYLGVIAGMSNRRLYKDNIIVVIFFTFFLTFVYESGVYLLSNPEITRSIMLYALKNIIFTEALYNGGLSIIVHILVMKINARFNFGDDYRQNTSAKRR
ncbi:MAG TPA: rod shape-determining protein MreD [Clostridiales bacterium]|nr:rod shape-determining protein MreD [Clostridiales bacterium]